MSEKSKLVVSEHGYKYWFLNGDFHREDGPAIEWPSGTKKWLLNGELHREDGPAIEWANGYKEWYLRGLRYSDKYEWFKALTLEQQYNYLWNINE
jgi:hypothetical protein